MQTNKREMNICVSCQECCHWMTFLIANLTGQQAEFYKARGCELIPTKDKSVTAIAVPSTCAHLDYETGCTIYNERPVFCREYDGRNDPFLPGQCDLIRFEQLGYLGEGKGKKNGAASCDPTVDDGEGN